MQRINILLNKISDLSRKGEKIDLIEVDLMLDYTRVLYADLQELRNNKVYNTNSSTDKTPNENTAHIPQEEVPNEESPNLPKEDNTSNNIEVAKEASVTSNEIAPPLFATKTVSQPQINIKKFIGINDKYQFISELFDNDTDAYNEVITRINTFNTAHKAIEWLEKEISNEKGWDENSDSVKMFYDTVSNFFSSI